MEVFTFASVLDLNMGYYHIKLEHDADAQELCTVVFPWYTGKYKYKRLPMDIKISRILMFFKTSYLTMSQNMEYIKTYLDDFVDTNK
jgi:hypothetical protein